MHPTTHLKELQTLENKFSEMLYPIKLDCTLTNKDKF